MTKFTIVSNVTIKFVKISAVKKCNSSNTMFSCTRLLSDLSVKLSNKS